ncbi:hypothetical protein LY76DRAFT_234673 [Colletotrichum caudatum]|nr:hypothetical protein LY76DRAFT_234673 [Colletotrichum caudatum]
MWSKKCAWGVVFFCLGKVRWTSFMRHALRILPYFLGYPYTLLWRGGRSLLLLIPRHLSYEAGRSSSEHYRNPNLSKQRT